MPYLKPVIIGGGPAGLAAAHSLGERNIPVVVLEKEAQVGGLCKTIEYKGFRCDIGGHRFFTKNKEVQTLWNRTLGDDFLVRPRLSRIYYRGKFFYYPLKISNALQGLGLYESMRLVFSYCKFRLFPVTPEKTFEDWVTNRFGQVLYSIFFKTYTEKVWGIPCTQLSADWAAQRIRNLSLFRALLNAMGVGRNRKVASLIEQFHYPPLGPGQMYETMTDRIKRLGGKVRNNQEVVEIQHAQGQVTAVSSLEAGGKNIWPASHCFSSMPITELVQKMWPPAPEMVIKAVMSLRYRSIITVNLLLNRPAPLPDNWIYLHAPEVKAARLQLFQNWSPFMVPADGRGSISLEFFCFEGDELWQMTDAALIRLAKEDLMRLGVVDVSEVFDGFVVRYAKAYPIYEDDYYKHLHIIKDWLSQFSNLYCIGRYGQFRYNNMDHSIMTAFLAVRRMLGDDVDPWSVNAEAEYLEEK